MSNSSDTLF